MIVTWSLFFNLLMLNYINIEHSAKRQVLRCMHNLTLMKFDSNTGPVPFILAIDIHLYIS